MIEALKSDSNFMAIYQGEKEEAITGFLGEVEFKGKIDCLNVDRGYFVDIKTTKGPIDDKIWNGEERVFGLKLMGISCRWLLTKQCLKLSIINLLSRLFTQ